ncbi:MAG: hypothetical protein HFG53_15575 [Lachnospiraceae bacterium]|jgi:tetratricopeptide (TPR) repeat protein|nr:hypothetical protein [Lachnospiraceae bacterium]
MKQNSKRVHLVAVIIFSIAVLSGCLNSKYRYEETMNSEILDFEEYQTAVDYYNAQNYREAILYYELTLARIKETIQPGTSMEYWIKGQIGDCYITTGNLDRAGAYLQEAEEGLEKKDNVNMLGSIYQSEGIYYGNLKQYDTALMYYEKALKYADADEIIRIYRLMATAYANMNMVEKALEYCDHAIELGEKQNDAGALANVYYRKGSILASEEKLEEAKKCYEIGMRYAAYYWKEDDIKVAEGYRFLSRASVMEQDYETAYLYCRKEMDIYTSQNAAYTYDDVIVNIYNNMGYLNTKLGNRNAALKMIRKAYDIAIVEKERDAVIKEFYDNNILNNIELFYEEFIHDGTDYETWFKENFES